MASTRIDGDLPLGRLLSRREALALIRAGHAPKPGTEIEIDDVRGTVQGREGELYRVGLAGGEAGKTVFAGVGKTDAEIAAGLDAGVLMFNVESEAELHALVEVAKSAGHRASVALRVKPSLPPKTHVKTDTSVKGVKFGLDIDTVLEFAQKMAGNPHVKIAGLHMHLGSPILSVQPYQQAVEKALARREAVRLQQAARRGEAAQDDVGRRGGR